MLPRSVDENLSFLLAELDGQLDTLQTYFEARDADLARKLCQRAGYAQNLGARIQSACHVGLSSKKLTEADRLRLQNIDAVARNLDLISRLARRGLSHAAQVQRVKALRPETYVKPVRQIRAALGLVQLALHDSDSRMAVKIGEVKGKLDIFYGDLFETYTSDMRRAKHTEDLANALLTASDVGRMGEALQGIGEAILSINIGQKVQFDQYFTLRSVLSESVPMGAQIALEPLAETRSGSAISQVSTRNAEGDVIDAVFKDGDRKKVRDERAGVKSWNAVYPGLAPQILSYEKRGQSAGMLIEHLSGDTFEHILLNGSDADLYRAQQALHHTLRDIWKRTKSKTRPHMAAMDQLTRRLPEMRRVHPDFADDAQTVQGVKISGFERLIKQAAAREAGLPAPFSVYIHGDFNLDNVIYDAQEAKIRFIDLHRSRYMDYVQDVSVFMVSNYRLQVNDGPLRTRIAQVAGEMHKMAAKFARLHQDRTFEYRLALGLARSFASSTRFIFDKDHARRMHLRARYLLETALAVPDGEEASLKLPIGELFGA